ncbi:MAG: hypothetical protein IKJ09_08970 [Bacteroidaceae bacterium]|nr:hypothetical protein [Bacteroidaceae bacterium]
MSGRPKYKLKTTKVEKSVVEAYQKLERSVVKSYFAVENAFVGAYQKRRLRTSLWILSWKK